MESKAKALRHGARNSPGKTLRWAVALSVLVVLAIGMSVYADHTK